LYLIWAFSFARIVFCIVEVVFIVFIRLCMYGFKGACLLWNKTKLWLQVRGLSPDELAVLQFCSNHLISLDNIRDQLPCADQALSLALNKLKHKEILSPIYLPQRLLVLTEFGCKIVANQAYKKQIGRNV